HDLTLEQRGVDHRLRVFVLPERAKLHVARDTHYRDPGRGRVLGPESHSLPQRIFTRPVTPRERRTDDHHLSRLRIIARREVASRDKRYAHRVKIIRADVVIINRVAFGGIDVRFAFDRVPAIDATPDEWIDKRGAG